jgi:hypothetical protein
MLLDHEPRADHFDHASADTDAEGRCTAYHVIDFEPCSARQHFDSFFPLAQFRRRLGSDGRGSELERAPA